MAFVAVVEDDEQLRTAIAELIASCGIEARGFGTAREYLDSATIARTGCLIADIQMTGMNGLELHKTLRDRGYRIPVIFITAFADEPMRQEAEALGAFSLLRKPFDMGMLMACIDAALNSTKRQSGA